MLVEAFFQSQVLIYLFTNLYPERSIVRRKIVRGGLVSKGRNLVKMELVNMPSLHVREYQDLSKKQITTFLLGGQKKK